MGQSSPAIMLGLKTYPAGVGDEDEGLIADFAEPFALADIESAFGGHTVRVRQAWADFAAFCEARGVTLPAPELFFTTTETA